MNLSRATSCCGVGELNGLYSNPIECLKLIRSRGKYGMYMFTDRKGAKRGQKLMQFIKDNNLAVSLTETGWYKNPNSGALIQLWTFVPDWVKMEEVVKFAGAFKVGDYVKVAGLEEVYKITSVIGDRRYQIKNKAGQGRERDEFNLTAYKATKKDE